MKYWRGYLVAAITALCAWGLTQFAAGHSQLVDMVYPYMTRMVIGGLTQWSSGFDSCLWQTILLIFVLLVIAIIVAVILLKGNLVQWIGWILASVSIVFLLHTGLYGLNAHAGSLAADVRLEVTDYSVTALEEAAIYYQSQAKAIVEDISRDSKGYAEFAEFSELAEQAADGFDALTYEYLYPVFAGSTVPVKELGWSGIYTATGTTGVTVALTGEAAVNPSVPDAGLPYAICREMARRMSIAVEHDADFAAFLACTANDSVQFRYSGYLLAYRACVKALEAVDSPSGRSALVRVTNGASAKMEADLEKYNSFVGKNAAVSDDLVNLLVSWHVQTVVLPSQVEEPEDLFDPYDETNSQLQDILNPSAP